MGSLLMPPLPNTPFVRNISLLFTEISLYRSKRGFRYMLFEEAGQCRTLYTYPKYKTKLKSQYHLHSKMSFLSKGYCICVSGMPTKKVVLISSETNGVHPSYAEASSLSIVAHLRWGEMDGRLALLRLGSSVGNRVWDTNFCTLVFASIASYKGQLWALDYLGRFFLMDYNSLQMTQVAPPLSIVQGPGEKRLFEADGDLYLAHFKKDGSVAAYKLSDQYNKWLTHNGNIHDKLDADYYSKLLSETRFTSNIMPRDRSRN